MDIWSQIFAEKYLNQILCPYGQRGGGGEGSQPNVGRYGQRGGESKIMARINTTVYRKPTNTDIHITVTHIHIPPKILACLHFCLSNLIHRHNDTLVTVIMLSVK